MKNQDIFTITHEVLSGYRQVLAILKREHANEYKTFLDGYPLNICCSSMCAQSVASEKDEVVKIGKSAVLPKNSLPAPCTNCQKEMRNKSNHHLVIPRDKSLNESLGITRNSSYDLDMTYEIIINSRILAYLLNYASGNYLNVGIAYSPGLLETVALDWISLIIPNLSMTITKDSTYYRVQGSLHAQVTKANLNNSLLMRNTDIEYAGAGRFNRPGSWYLYLASDLQTAVKEIRLQPGKNFFYSKFVVRKEFPCLDARLSALAECMNIDYENKQYDVLARGANLPLYILLSSGLLAMSYFMQFVSTASDDTKKFQRIYFVSQSVADVVKKKGLHAIVYDSTRNRGGVNLSFFNKEKVDDYFIQHKTIQKELKKGSSNSDEDTIANDSSE